MTNFDAWDRKFSGQVDLVINADDETIDKSVHELKDLMVKRTPIGRPELWNTPAPKGYTPGQLRASWELEKHGLGSYTITNEQPYAFRVETGWSTQAPTGMMRVSALEWPNIVERNRKKL